MRVPTGRRAPDREGGDWLERSAPGLSGMRLRFLHPEVQRPAHAVQLDPDGPPAREAGRRLERAGVAAARREPGAHQRRVFRRISLCSSGESPASVSCHAGPRAGTPRGPSGGTRGRAPGRVKKS